MKRLLPALLSLACTVSFPVLAASAPDSHPCAAPWLGRIINVHYPIGGFRLEFARDGRTLSWTSLTDPQLHDTVIYTAREVKPGVHALSWYEPRYNEDAFQFQDWNTHVVHAVLIADQPEIQSSTGTFEVVGSVP